MHIPKFKKSPYDLNEYELLTKNICVHKDSHIEIYTYIQKN